VPCVCYERLTGLSLAADARGGEVLTTHSKAVGWTYLIAFGALNFASSVIPNPVLAQEKSIKPAVYQVHGSLTPSPTTKLTEKLELPDLPEYKGKAKFVSGSANPSALGSNYVEHFIAEEEPNQVLDWYKRTFASANWKILNTDGSSITAKKSDGTSCVIIVNPSYNHGARTEFELSYHEIRKK
jgi:hypothetical protein